MVRGFQRGPTPPHYLLFSESGGTGEPGRWRFMLRASDGSDRLEADDVEPDACGERLELLTVVRGLEALDQPSRVTLMTPSAYVREGIRYGLHDWRDNGWRWESFGEMVPVKDRDLWQRVERALGFHDVECRHWRFDPPHRPPWSSGTARHERKGRPEAQAVGRPAGVSEPRPAGGQDQRPTGGRPGGWKRRVGRAWQALVCRLAFG